jgi:hypothetical protein
MCTAGTPFEHVALADEQDALVADTAKEQGGQGHRAL